MMLDLAKQYPEYSEMAAKVTVLETTSGEYYGKGYQDVQNRVPKIENTMQDLQWAPTTNMEDSLRGIFDAYKDQVAMARGLVD